MDLKTVIALLASVTALISLGLNIHVYLKNAKQETYKNKYDILYPNYADVLIKRIPVSFANLSFMVPTQNGIKEFTSDIHDLIKDIKIIEIINKPMYKLWSEKLMAIEDYVTTTADKIDNMTVDKNKYHKDELAKKLQEVYTIILTERFENTLSSKNNK